jgi:phosphoglycerate kinase
MSKKKNLRDIDRLALTGKTVLVRADLNVPVDDGVITDDQRIRASVPTLSLLCESGARVVVLSHLGRPRGVPDPAYSLEPVARRIAELMQGRATRFVPEPSGARVEADVADLKDGELAVLENTRFLAGDPANDPDLARRWAGLGDLFVNDAFGTAHRAHASTAGLATAMRKRGGEAVAGLLMERELRFLRDALQDPERPFVAILGGAKISGKIDVVEALLPRVDRLLIGGAMANTFFRALGFETGDSLVEDDRVEMARDTLERAGDRILLPVDCVVASEVIEGAEARVVDRSEVTSGDRIADIGPVTRSTFGQEIGEAKTIVWNGPMGVFEVPEFAQGTISVAHSLALACDRGAAGIIGGGDSAAAAVQAGVEGRVTHVSTGGGASLALLAGSDLPGVDTLSDGA